MFRFPFKLTAFALVLICLTSVSSWAHKPISAEQNPDSYTGAVEVADPEISQVYYSNLDPQRPQTWMVFDGSAGESIYFSIGIPVIDRLKDFRPKIALIGPGLPIHSLGFPTPAGTGRIFDSRSRPESFHEPVTGTESSILLERRVVLAESGRFYLVAYADSDLPENPKLWISVGTKEQFGLSDLLKLGKIRREVREFHEVD